MLYGCIKFYNKKSKFGFIQQLETNKEFYFYLKAPKEELLPNDVVSFELKESKKGHDAVNVAKVPERGD